VRDSTFAAVARSLSVEFARRDEFADGAFPRIDLGGHILNRVHRFERRCRQFLQSRLCDNHKETRHPPGVSSECPSAISMLFITENAQGFDDRPGILSDQMEVVLDPHPA